MAERGTVEILLAEVGKALLPLQLAVSSQQSFFAFMLKLGWQADSIPQPLRDLGTGLDTLFITLRKIVGEGLAADGSVGIESSSASTSFSLDDIVALRNAIQQIIDGIQDIATAPDAVFPPSLLADNFKAEFPRQLINFLIIDYLTTYQSSLTFALRALGVIKTRYVPPTGNRIAFIEYTIDFSDLPRILESPTIVLENAFGWGTDSFNYRLLVSQVDNLMSVIGVDVFVEELRTDTAKKIEGDVDLPDDPVRTVLKGVFFRRARPTMVMSADIRMLYLPKDGDLKPGFALMPSFNGLLNFTFQLGPDIAVIIQSDLDLQGGVALLVRPENEIEMMLGFNNTGAPTHATGSVRVGVERSQLDNSPILIFGSADSTRLQFRKLSGAGGVRLDAQDTVDVYAEFEAKGLEFILKLDGADGFLTKILPGDGIRMGSDLVLGISYLQGFYFRGTTNLEIALPTHIQLGPIELQSLTVSMNPKNGTLPISLGASLKAELGPLVALVENMGLTGTFSFPEQGGNLGPLDLMLAFKPPNGVGLSIDAGVVKGGGYLYLDYDKGEYAGALELTISDWLALKAIGLINTKLPNGQSGFSMLIIITAEFSPGIQLGFGFTLIGVGGLLGLNRTLLLDPLVQGVRTGAVNSILFPTDVIANAPKIISDLRAIFPPEEGIFLIGPMAKIGWGTPTLISIALGVIIEIPGNVIILGRLRVALPTEEEAVLILQVSFVGALEFDKRRIWFFATMYESRVLFITLEGEMGLLMDFSDNPNFVLSVGGFHPRFTPPPLPFPSPARISLSIINESWARLQAETYFAVTTNSVQMGVRADAFFGFDALSVEGYFSFDALLRFSPFYLIVEISTGFSVKVFGVGVWGVHLRGTLEGPTPWHITGEAEIELLFFSISVDVDVTFGDRRAETLPPIDVLPKLKAEFEKPENWRALPPTSGKLFVSLRDLGEERALVLHPVGVLQISQKFAPLNLPLDKIGNQKPSDINKASVSVLTTSLATKGPAKDQFAAAQYREMDDAAKLSAPAFELMDSGVELGAAGQTWAVGSLAIRNVRYEMIILDSAFKRFRRSFFKFWDSLFTHFRAGASISRASISLASEKRLQPFAEKVTVTVDQYTVAYQSDNTAVAGTATFTSYAEAQAYMFETVRMNPSKVEEVHVIPFAEVNR